MVEIDPNHRPEPSEVDREFPHSDRYGKPEEYQSWFSRMHELQLAGADNKTVIVVRDQGRTTTVDGERRREIVGVRASVSRRKDNFTTDPISDGVVFFDGTSRGDTSVFEWLDTALNSFSGENTGTDSNVAPTAEGRKVIVEQSIRKYQSSIQRALIAQTPQE